MNKLMLLAAAAAAAASSQAGAQDAPRDHSGNWMKRDLTRQQAQQMADMLFQRIDLNHDGVVTRAEAEQAAAQFGSGERAERMMSRVFGDAQSVTEAQAEAQALARFDRQDLNHDGVVTAAERQAARANR